VEHDDVDVGRVVLRGAAEAISVGAKARPRIGSFIALAIEQKPGGRWASCWW
jgi:hypothetical protein